MMYVSTSLKLETLITIVKYIMSMYAPIWFAIKAASSLKNGAQHLFMMIKLT